MSINTFKPLSTLIVKFEEVYIASLPCKTTSLTMTVMLQKSNSGRFAAELVLIII